MLLAGIAPLASRNDVAPSRTPAAHERHYVVHRQRLWGEAAAAIVADPARSSALPPLRAAELPCPRALAADVLAVSRGGKGSERENASMDLPRFRGYTRVTGGRRGCERVSSRIESFLDHDTGAGHPESADRLLAIGRWLDAQPGARSPGSSTRARRPCRSSSACTSPSTSSAWKSPRTCRVTRSTPTRRYRPGPSRRRAGPRAASWRSSMQSWPGGSTTVSPSCALRGTMPNATARWAFVSSTTSRSRRRISERRTASSAYWSSTGTFTTATARSTRSTPIPACCSFRLTSIRSIPAPARLERSALEKAKGFTLNLPFPAGYGDAQYVQAFVDVVEPVARRFSPQFVLVSAGFDAHRRDPLAGMDVTEVGFAQPRAAAPSGRT